MRRFSRKSSRATFGFSRATDSARCAPYARRIRPLPPKRRMSLQKRTRKEPSPNSVRARSESAAESGRERSAASGVSANDFTSRRRMAACEPPCRYNHPNRHVHLQNSVASLQYSTDTLFHPSSCEHQIRGRCAARHYMAGPPYRGSVARGLAAASQFALRAHPTRRLRRGRIPRRTFAAIAHNQKNRERARKANGQ